jgi:hypothetical protein
MSQDKIDLNREWMEVVEKFGPWTTLNIPIGSEIYTMQPGLKMGQEGHARTIIQMVSDYSDKPLSELRILDLACLEGIYSIELALQGAKVLGIEGRRTNVEKARFVQKTLNLENLRFVQDDVRNLSVAKYGRFDVVLCAGILYHLDSPDVFAFLENIFDVTEDFAIIDTHFAQTETCSVQHGNTSYHGFKFLEHQPSASSDDRERAIYASLDNTYSFWFTKCSLMNCLGDLGFTSVLECQYPAVQDYLDRGMFLAKKGKRTPLAFVPPESPGVRNYPRGYARTPMFPPTAPKWSTRNVAARVKGVLKQVLGRGN